MFKTENSTPFKCMVENIGVCKVKKNIKILKDKKAMVKVIKRESHHPCHPKETFSRTFKHIMINT